MINWKAPIEFSTILVTKQIVFLLGWVTARAKGDSRTQRSCILSFKGKYMFYPKASHILTLKSMLKGGHSHRHSPGGKYLSTDGHKISAQDGLGLSSSLVAASESTVNAESELELWWAASAEKHSYVGLSVLISPLFTMGYMESVLPKTFDWEIVPYCLVSFLQNAALQKWGWKKKGSEYQLINHLYQWLLLLVSSIESLLYSEFLNI